MIRPEQRADVRVVRAHRRLDAAAPWVILVDVHGLDVTPHRANDLAPAKAALKAALALWRFGALAH